MLDREDTGMQQVKPVAEGGPRLRRGKLKKLLLLLAIEAFQI
jgi:hypothetical protein